MQELFEIGTVLLACVMFVLVAAAFLSTAITAVR